MTPAFASVTELLGSVGDELGPSRWIVVDQERIDGFARVTEDEQWIHVDPTRASTGPFGATIAHGYLTLSLVAPIVMELLTVGRLHSAVNYGLNRVRFPAPVRSGGRVRGRLTVVDATMRGDVAQVTVAVTVEVDGGERPACVAELVMHLRPDETGA